jgi:hypothetical protein
MRCQSGINEWNSAFSIFIVYRSPIPNNMYPFSYSILHTVGDDVRSVASTSSGVNVIYLPSLFLCV